jgi:hypothetical protein
MLQPPLEEKALFAGHLTVEQLDAKESCILLAGLPQGLQTKCLLKVLEHRQAQLLAILGACQRWRLPCGALQLMVLQVPSLMLHACVVVVNIP